MLAAASAESERHMERGVTVGGQRRRHGSSEEGADLSGAPHALLRQPISWADLLAARQPSWLLV